MNTPILQDFSWDRMIAAVEAASLPCELTGKQGGTPVPQVGQV